jgi:hypothetical protein
MTRHSNDPSKIGSTIQMPSTVAFEENSSILSTGMIETNSHGAPIRWQLAAVLVLWPRFEGGARMRKFIATGSAVAALALMAPLGAFAGDPHTGTPGQPNQSCQAEPSTPGNAANAPGSAFNDAGKAGTVYAGTQPQNSKNPKSVSQYDVACFQVSPH